MRFHEIPKSWSRVTGPVGEPAVSLDLIKKHARLPDDLTDEDALLEAYIATAEKHIEDIAEITLREQTLLLKMPTLPDGSCWVDDSIPVRLERPIVSAIEWVKYYDEDNVLQTLDEADYTLWENNQAPPILLVNSDILSLLSAERMDAFQVQFTAGNEVVPDDAKLLIMQLVGHWYRNREAVGLAIGQGYQRVDLTYETLMDNLRWRLYP